MYIGQKCTMEMEASKQIGKYLCIFISDLLYELESTV